MTGDQLRMELHASFGRISWLLTHYKVRFSYAAKDERVRRGLSKLTTEALHLIWHLQLPSPGGELTDEGRQAKERAKRPPKRVRSLIKIDHTAATERTALREKLAGHFERANADFSLLDPLMPSTEQSAIVTSQPTPINEPAPASSAMTCRHCNEPIIYSPSDALYFHKACQWGSSDIAAADYDDKHFCNAERSCFAQARLKSG